MIKDLMAGFYIIILVIFLMLGLVLLFTDPTSQQTDSYLTAKVKLIERFSGIRLTTKEADCVDIVLQIHPKEEQ